MVQSAIAATYTRLVTLLITRDNGDEKSRSSGADGIPLARTVLKRRPCTEGPGPCMIIGAVDAATPAVSRASPCDSIAFLGTMERDGNPATVIHSGWKDREDDVLRYFCPRVLRGATRRGCSAKIYLPLLFICFRPFVLSSA